MRNSRRAVLVPAATFILGVVATLAVVPQLASATPEAESPYAAVSQLGRVLVAVENDYVEPVDRAKLVNGAIKGMVAVLDPHSSYLPPHDFTEFQSDTEGRFGGVGIEVDARSDSLTVIATFEGSPAERAGVRPGDRIVAVDGFDVTSSGLDKVVQRMRGAPGSHVKLTLKRASEKGLLVFDLSRENIHVPSVSSRLLDGDVAYVRLRQFQDHSHDELLAAAAKLRGEAKGAIQGVILDIRTNPGGLVDEAAEIADEFLPSGTIYTTRHRGRVVDDVKARAGGAFSSLPAVVLVNEYSASASELVAGALQDNRHALIVGARTFGKGSVQSILSLPGGAGLKLTTARYYTPSGHAVQADGITPDILVETSRVVASQTPALRERDLEGHLSAEGTREASDAGVEAQDAGAQDDLARSEARNVPRDPSRGQDFVLRMGYQVLKTLLGKGPIVR